MDKTYIKTQIAMRQAEVPNNFKRYENPLSINENKIVTVLVVKKCEKYVIDLNHTKLTNTLE